MPDGNNARALQLAADIERAQLTLQTIVDEVTSIPDSGSKLMVVAGAISHGWPDNDESRIAFNAVNAMSVMLTIQDHRNELEEVRAGS